jgi:hypothetical protein
MFVAPPTVVFFSLSQIEITSRRSAPLHDIGFGLTGGGLLLLLYTVGLDYWDQTATERTFKKALSQA